MGTQVTGKAAPNTWGTTGGERKTQHLGDDRGARRNRRRTGSPLWDQAGYPQTEGGYYETDDLTFPQSHGGYYAGGYANAQPAASPLGYSCPSRDSPLGPPAFSPYENETLLGNSRHTGGWSRTQSDNFLVVPKPTAEFLRKTKSGEVKNLFEECGGPQTRPQIGLIPPLSKMSNMSGSQEESKMSNMSGSREEGSSESRAQRNGLGVS